MDSSRTWIATGVVGTVAGVAVLIVTTDVVGTVSAFLGGLSGAEFIALANKAASGGGTTAAGAGSSGAAGSNGYPEECPGGGSGEGPSKRDMAENVGSGVATGAGSEVAGEKVARSAGGSAAWGIIGDMVGLLMAGPDIYCGLMAMDPTRGTGQGMGKFNKGVQEVADRPGVDTLE